MRKVLVLAAVIGLVTAGVSFAQQAGNAGGGGVYALTITLFAIDDNLNVLHNYTPGGPTSQAVLTGPTPGAAAYRMDVHIAMPKKAIYLPDGTLMPDLAYCFGNARFNINILWPGITPINMGAGPWYVNADDQRLRVDTNGTALGGLAPLFKDNMDAGPSGTDLQQILFSLAAPLSLPLHSADPRQYVGQPWTGSPANVPNVVNTIGWPTGDTYVGSVIFEWNGTVPAHAPHTLVHVDLLQTSFISNITHPAFWPGQEPLSRGKLYVDWDAQFGNRGGRVLDAWITPEPASLALLALAGLTLLPRRKA